MKSPTPNVLKVPQSLPQSPRILVDSGTSPFFPPLQIPSLNFSPPSQVPNPIFPMFQFSQPSTKIHEPAIKFKGFDLGGHRKNKYVRTTSIDAPPPPKPLIKRLSWEERRQPTSWRDERFQINDVLKESKELLRKYSDPKLQIHEPGTSSLTFLQSAFKAKLASLFKNKKKYTIAEPSARENSESYAIHRCDSCQSLPTLMLDKKRNSKPKGDKLDRRTLKQMKKISLDRFRADGKLKSLNLNPPQWLGGSFDNLLLLNRMKKRQTAMGVYDTYHGRPLLSHTSRLRAFFKYRKPSESDDATTLSFDYDSGEMSDTSSLARSSTDVGDDSSSFSDLTTKSSNYRYKIRSNNSIHSMTQPRNSRKIRKSATAVQSPNRSFETAQYLTNAKSSDIGSRVAQHLNFPMNPKSSPYHLTHQMSAPVLNNRSDHPMTSVMTNQQPSLGQFTKPNYYPSLSMPAASVHVNQNPNQMIKAFFTSGPASSNECPLVSFLLSLTQIEFG